MVFIYVCLWYKCLFIINDIVKIKGTRTIPTNIVLAFYCCLTIVGFPQERSFIEQEHHHFLTNNAKKNIKFKAGEPKLQKYNQMKLHQP